MRKTLALMFAFALLSVSFVAASSNTLVAGTVYYSDGTTPVVGANVEVQCEDNTRLDESDSFGHYDVWFGSNQCPSGSTATVIATKDDMYGSNTGEVICTDGQCPFDIALIDVTIPEFATFGLIAAALAGVGIVAMRRRK